VDETSIGGWLEALASSAPAPGGGAAGALEAAVGAALIEMSASLTIGKAAYAEHEAELVAARDRATALRAEALELVDEDAKAFSAVMDAYRLPRDEAAREQRIQEALVVAADVPTRTARNAGETVGLAEQIAPHTNVNVVSDVAVAAASARAALVAALLNVEANRNGITDPVTRDELASVVGEIEAQLERADAVVATVRALGSG
jgi:formiminotetrahydrofolate cyclodeaminase